jgi:hypothetical protein
MEDERRPTRHPLLDAIPAAGAYRLVPAVLHQRRAREAGTRRHS